MTERSNASGAILSRPLSAIEFALGAAIVLGHNVWGVVPNEVIILFFAALISVRLREGGFAALGFVWPRSWTVIIVIAIAAAALRILAGEIVEPWAAQYWPPVVAPSGAENIRGNPSVALYWLGLVWTFAAIGEETVYRGYLTKRAADIDGGGWFAWAMATILVSALFGFGHFYKGPAGVIDSAVAGLIFGTAYLASGRVLWAPILAHGLVDTIGVAALYFGLAD